jgi:hypothetical protein
MTAATAKLRSTARRLAGVGAAGAILAMTPGFAQPASAETTTSPVGIWTVTTKESDHDATQGTITFNSDHTLLLQAHNGPDGKPVFTGTGTWVSPGGDIFSYRLTHPLPGTRTGTAHVALAGRFSATTFSADGATVRDYDDGGVETVTITMNGTRQ